MPFIFIGVDVDFTARKAIEARITKINSGFRKELEVVSRRVKEDINDHFNKAVDETGKGWQLRTNSRGGNRGNWPLLNRTGTGKSASTDNAIVKINNNELTMRINSFSPSRKSKGKAQPKRTDEYMPYHRDGSPGGRIVKRNFAYISDEALSDSVNFIARSIISG